MSPPPPHSRRVAALAGAAAFGLIAGPSAAQIEGGQRGVAPINSDASYEVGGIRVDERGKTGLEAREAAWKTAMRLGWRKLWATQRGGAAPGLSDGQLFGIVSGVIVEDEQVGPSRYVARLGVMFDRARAGQILGIGGIRQRSAPLLVVPVFWDGAVPLSLEGRNDWQRAWARFNTGGSPIDYVRLTGVGPDQLLVNAMQATRGERRWWRVVLDSYGAADVIQPEVRLVRQWPGGPVLATFVAREGPDGRVLGRFDLRAASAEQLPALLDSGVRRLDAIYTQALAAGALSPDPTLVIEQPAEALPSPPPPEPTVERDEPGEGGLIISDGPNGPAPSAPPPPSVQSLAVQVNTPDAASVTAAESSLRGTPGVQGASTTSTAVGGTSVVRVSFAGDLDALAAALRARGWSVTTGSGALRISR